MKTSHTSRKVAETVVGAAIGAAIAGPAGAVAGGLIGSQVSAHTPHPGSDETSRPPAPATDGAVVHAQLARILVPVDFSPFSYGALRFAREWAQRFGSEIRVLHVIEPINTFGVLGMESVAPTLEPVDFHEVARAELDKLARETSPDPAKVSVRLRDGAASHEIIAAAREWKADLIIIATHGRTGLSHVLLGSTAEQVVRHAPCPVLTLRSMTHD